MSAAGDRIANLSLEERALLFERLRAKKEREAASGAAPGAIPRRPADGVAPPLSFAQQRLWFLNRLAPDDPAYNVSAAVGIHGVVDTAAFHRALQAVVERHESLRTTFRQTAAGPVQAVAPCLGLELPVVDLSDLGGAGGMAEGERLYRLETRLPFDLTAGPLLRVLLLRFAPRHHVLAFSMHHIVSDGWSLGLLIRDLAAFYRAFVTGEPSGLPGLPIQYPDFAVWQRGWLSGERLEAQLAVWKRRLADLPEPLAFPTDRPRPPMKTSAGERQWWSLDARTVERVRELAGREGATPFMVLLAAFQALLHRYTGQTDLVVGSPVANRNRGEIQNLIGFFVNTLALRGDLAGDPPFRELVSRAREVALEAYSHQDLPFEKLVEELHPPRDPSRTPLFQVTLTLQNTPEPAVDLEGFRLEPMRADNRTAHYDLEMSFEPRLGGGLAGIVTRNTGLFDAATAARLTAHFQTLLAGALAAPDRRLSELPLLSPEERHRLLVEWGCGRQAEDVSALLPRFAELAAARPDDPAVAAPGLVFTRGELNQRANRLAHHLRRLGAGPEVVVAVLLGRSPELVVSVLGIWKSGAAYLPLDPVFPKERLATVLADSGARMVVTVGDLASRVPAGWQVLALDSADLARESGNDLPPLADPANLAYAVYTSGSTGRPKGVAVSWNSLENLVAWQHRVRPLEVGERVSLLASPSFDASLWELAAYLPAGAEIRIPDEETRISPRLLARWFARERIESGFLPTPAAEAFVAEPESAGTSLRHLYTGGDRLHRLARQDLTFTVDNLYGPSEATVVVSWAPAVERQDAGRDPSIGRPIDGVRIYLLDSGLRPVPLGAWGELFAAGRALARGYLGSPDLTAERYLPDPHGEPGSRMYRTGDRARFRPDGEIEVAGRLDHQVKVRGFRIELGEIEAALRAHPEVEQAVAAVRDEPARLAAWVVPRGRGGEDLPAVLREHLRRLLPDYMVPAVIAVLDKLPLTASGKLDRRALLALSPAAAPARDFVPPATEEERAIAAVWAEVLGVGRVGADDNFFDLGGHSMLLARVQTVLAERLGRDLPLLKLIEHPTVRALAAFLAGGEGGPAPGESRERALRQRRGLELQRQRLAAARRSV